MGAECDTWTEPQVVLDRGHYRNDGFKIASRSIG